MNRYALYYTKRELHDWMCTNVSFPSTYILQEHAKGTYCYLTFLLMHLQTGLLTDQTENAHYVRKKLCHHRGTQVKSFREFKKHTAQNFMCYWHLFPVISKMHVCINYKNCFTFHAKHSWRTNKVLSKLSLQCRKP